MNLDDVERCKHLINSYLTSIVKEDRGIGKQGLRKRAVTRGNLSKRKLKRINFTKFQRLYSKNRKKAFDSLYNNNCLDETLDAGTAFSYWKHLLTHIAIDEPNPQNIQLNEVVVVFDENLIYPEEIARHNPRGKSSAGLDSLCTIP